MAVVVIDTIKPKNNGTFPVVEAGDVKVTDSKRLDAALNDKANQSDVTALQSAVNGKASQADLNALSSAVAGKQNALTTEQLAACNSGITSELVTQIGTNTTAIEGKADATDLASINAAVATKANASDVATETESLQAQIDNIVSGSTADSEVINARVGADGVTYNTLKTRLDADFNNLNSDIGTLENELYYKREQAFELSDLDPTPDNEYYFMPFTFIQGKNYTVRSTKAAKMWLRAVKYTKPSIQSVGDIGTTPVTFTAEANLNWCAIYCQLEQNESFTVYIQADDGKVFQLETTVTGLSNTTNKNNTDLDQFKNPALSEFNENQFTVAARSHYGGNLIESTTRVTNIVSGTFKNITIKPDNSVKFFVYDESGTLSGWLTSTWLLSGSEKHDIVLAYNDDRTISDKSDLLSHFDITTEMCTKSEKLEKSTEITTDIKPNFFDTVYDYKWVIGNLSVGASSADAGGELLVNTTNRISTTNYNWVASDKVVRVNIASGMSVRILFYSEKNQDSTIYTAAQREWHSESNYTEAAPSGAKYYRISARFNDDRDIASSDGAGITSPNSKATIDVLINNYNRLPNDYNNKKISILGDSISTFGGSASDEPSERISDGTYTYAGNRCRYPQYNLLTNVNNTYWMKLISDFNMTLGINESWAGSRVSWDGTTESQDIGANKHIASATRIGHLGENGTPDIILVNGGTNDIGADVPIGTFNTEDPSNYTTEQIAALPVATFADAYRTMLIRLQKSYPTSQILVLLPNFTTTYYTPPEADAYCEIIKEACDYFGIKWLDMRASGITMFNRTTYLPDGIHYNANGMQVIEKNIKKFFEYNLTI